MGKPWLGRGMMNIHILVSLDCYEKSITDCVRNKQILIFVKFEKWEVQGQSTYRSESDKATCPGS